MKIKFKKFQDGGIIDTYTALLDAGVKPQAAADYAHLSKIESKPGAYYTTKGRYVHTLELFAHDTVTSRKYNSLKNSGSFTLFKQGLRKTKYNTRDQFYNSELPKGRAEDIRVINDYNKQHGISPVVSLYNNIDNNYV